MKIDSELTVKIELDGIEVEALRTFLGNHSEDDYKAKTNSEGDEIILFKIFDELNDLLP